MSENIGAQLERMPWQAQVLRLTAFPIPSPTTRQAGWWEEIVGQTPAAITSRPKQGSYHEEGPFSNGRLICEIASARIDWLFIPGDLEAEDDGLATIGAFSDTLKTFRQLADQWFGLETCPSAQRLAFGVVLLQSVESKQTGYRQLSMYLPRIELDPENSSDFMYQINRPRESRSGIPNFKINRLMKWSVATLKRFPIQSLRGVGLGRTSFACRLELDVNTAQEFEGQIPREQMSTVFQELTDLAWEIAERGDIP